MANLGGERMKDLQGRFEYVISDFSKRDWSRVADGEFDLVVSCNAIHNVRAGETIRAVYEEIFGRVRSGGRFFNLDRGSATMEDQLDWFRSARLPGRGVPSEELRTLPLRRGSKP